MFNLLLLLEQKYGVILLEMPFSDLWLFMPALFITSE